MSKSLYVTAPIFYVNGDPHIGHTYTMIICDVIKRIALADGREVRLCGGSDEHGQKVEETANKLNITPAKLADLACEKFRSVATSLNCTFDDYVRTTSDRHKRCATSLWKMIADAGYLRRGKYEGWYSVRDETFLNDSEVCEGFSIETGAPVIRKSEDSYFFKLSDLQGRLLDFYEENPDFVYPAFRMNEIKSFVKSGLKDLSFSRKETSWGIEIPEKGFSGVMYVWVDALSNYLTSLGFPDDSPEYRTFWTSKNREVIHVVGKDILKFHAVYWPAMLLAANLPLPDMIAAHGWWLSHDGTKMSKSLRNIVDPVDLIEEYGSDAIRYFMMRESSISRDSSFSRDLLKSRFNKELADNLGNLMQRSLSMVFNNNQSVIPELNVIDSSGAEVMGKITNLVKSGWKKMRDLKLDTGITDIVNAVSLCNSFFSDKAPWESFKNGDTNSALSTLAVACETSRISFQGLKPIIPNSAELALNIMLANHGYEGERAISDFDCRGERSLEKKPEPIFVKFS